MANSDLINSVDIHLSSEADTIRLAKLFAAHAPQNLSLLLDGNLGAGKTFFARAFIQHLLDGAGDELEVPSPTYTLVQTYQINMQEVWHADLYRLTFWEELVELGLDTAFDRAICLVEWPDRLGPLAPPSAVTLNLSMGKQDTSRRASISNLSQLPDVLRRALANFTAA